MLSTLNKKYLDGYKELVEENLILKENTDKVSRSASGFTNFMKKVGQTTNDDYKAKSKENYEKMTRSALDEFERIRNRIN